MVDFKQDLDNLPSGLLMGIRCKCKEGHEWDVACATIWTQMPYCPECCERDYQRTHAKELPISWRGLWTSEMDELKDCKIVKEPNNV